MSVSKWVRLHIRHAVTLQALKYIDIATLTQPKKIGPTFYFMGLFRAPKNEFRRFKRQKGS